MKLSGHVKAWHSQEPGLDNNLLIQPKSKSNSPQSLSHTQWPSLPDLLYKQAAPDAEICSKLLERPFRRLDKNQLAHPYTVTLRPSLYGSLGSLSPHILNSRNVFYREPLKDWTDITNGQSVHNQCSSIGDKKP